MDLALNNLQSLICHKTQPTNIWFLNIHGTQMTVYAPLPFIFRLKDLVICFYGYFNKILFFIKIHRNNSGAYYTLTFWNIYLLNLLFVQFFFYQFKLNKNMNLYSWYYVLRHKIYIWFTANTRTCTYKKCNKLVAKIRKNNTINKHTFKWIFLCNSGKHFNLNGR